MRDIIKICTLHVNPVLCVVFGNKVIKHARNRVESLFILFMNSIFKERKCF